MLLENTVSWHLAERTEIALLPTYFVFPYSPLWYNARRQRQRPKGASSLMTYIHAIVAGDLQRVFYAVSLLVGVLPEGLLLIIYRMGFGRRGFGRGFGSFRVLRILFALLFTTLLGPVVLVALIAFIAYRFFTSRRGR
jgi:hypothetical protein